MGGPHGLTPNLPTNILDFRGFGSSIILVLRGGILMSIGDFPESLSRAMLVGVMLVGGLGVIRSARAVLIICIYIYIHTYVYT